MAYPSNLVFGIDGVDRCALSPSNQYGNRDFQNVPAIEKSNQTAGKETR